MLWFLKHAVVITILAFVFASIAQAAFAQSVWSTSPRYSNDYGHYDAYSRSQSNSYQHDYGRGSYDYRPSDGRFWINRYR